MVQEETSIKYISYLMFGGIHPSFLAPTAPSMTQHLKMTKMDLTFGRSKQYNIHGFKRQLVFMDGILDS